jgi:hypothetical protein
MFVMVGASQQQPVFPAGGLGAIARGRARVIPVPILRYRRRGMGDCLAMPGVSYANIAGAVCRDNSTGNIVSCSAPACGASSAPGAPAAGFVNTPVIQSIPVGGFTGDLNVPTLASTLGDMLEAKETSFNANLIAKGAVNVSADSQDFITEALEHCTEYASSQGCDNPQAVAQQFINQYIAWAQSQPASAYQSGDTGTLFSPGGAPPSGAGSGAGGGASTGQGRAVANVVFSNVSRPGQPIAVGDKWQIIVTGPPGSPVSVASTQNGNSLGSTPMGSIAGNGQLVVGATADAGTVGNWSEVWTIGSTQANLTFTVSAAPSGSGSGSGAGTGAGAGSGGSAGNAGAGAGSPAPSTGLDLSSITGLFTQSFSLFGVNVPVWAAAVAVGGVFLIAGKGGK